MNSEETKTLPPLAFMGGTKAMTLTPVVGTPRREYAEVFVPGEEPLEDGELRVTVLGSGNPFPTRAQASASILVEVGNPERDLLAFDLGAGSLSNYASLKLPVNQLNKLFITHLHADHMGDILTLSGSSSKVGRADGPVYVYGPSRTEPRLGTRHFCEAIHITREAVVSRQAQVVNQLPPIAGKQHATFKPVQIPPPAWWAEALIPID
jgi:ribonuclease Z